MAPPPPPALPKELFEEILLRFPPNEPAGLFRASVVCKPWCRLISGPRFRRRYREFHGTPPMLGILCGSLGRDGHETAFVPTSAFRSPPADLQRCQPIDAHHGRVLLLCPGKVWFWLDNSLMVWDPVSDERREVSIPIRACQLGFGYDWNAAVLCAAYQTCDHLDYHRGPFIIVFVGNSRTKMLISTYSSDTGIWSDTIFNDPDHYIEPDWPACAHVRNAIYFHSLSSQTALKYDLSLHEMSVIGLPPAATRLKPLVLTSTEDGGLGCTTIHGSKLYLWSRKDDSRIDAEWTQDRVIDLGMLLPSNAIVMYSTHAVGFKDGNGVVFFMSEGGLFTVDLKTKNLKQVSKGERVFSVLPYMTFYTPALGEVCKGEGPSAGGSNA